MRASASCRLTWPRRCCSSLTGQRRRQVDAHCQVAARLLLKLSDGRRELVNVLVRFAELALALVELLLHAADAALGSQLWTRKYLAPRAQCARRNASQTPANAPTADAVSRRSRRSGGPREHARRQLGRPSMLAEPAAPSRPEHGPYAKASQSQSWAERQAHERAKRDRQTRRRRRACDWTGVCRGPSSPDARRGKRGHRRCDTVERDAET